MKMSHNQQEEALAETEVDNVKLKKICVLPRGNKYYYPKSIPQERGPLATFICIIIISLLLLVDIFTNRNRVTSVLALYVLGTFINIVLQILFRTILVIEEFKHLNSRYENSYKKLLRDAYHFPMQVWIVSVITVIYAVYYFCSNNFFAEYQHGLFSIIFLLIPSIYLLGIVLRLDESPLNDSLWVAKNNGLDYGSGMAYSFYNGYLRLVLPKTGSEDKNLEELMQDYEDENRVKFAVYKLFILIPKSLNCFVSLKNEHCPSVEESSPLRPKTKTVAGVQDRIYKNSAYKIFSEKTKTKIYVSAEYATPLKTFKDVCDTSGEHTEYYEKHKKDIILQFYLTLKKVLERTGLNESCELIYYEDCYKNKEGQTCYYDVGKIILTRLKELKKRKREKTE